MTALILLSGGLLLYAVEKSIRPSAILELEAKAGETYFVRFKPIAHAAHSEPTLSFVAEHDALTQIRDCKLIVGQPRSPDH